MSDIVISNTLTQEEIYTALYSGLEPVLDKLKPYPKDSTTVKVSSIAMDYFDSNNFKITSDVFEQKDTSYLRSEHLPLNVKIPLFLACALAASVLVLFYLGFSIIYSLSHHHGEQDINWGPYGWGPYGNNPRIDEIEQKIPLEEEIKHQLIKMSADIADKDIGRNRFSSILAEVSIEVFCPTLSSSKTILAQQCKVL